MSPSPDRAPASILRSHREWLDTVRDMPANELPCNGSTVAFAVTVADQAVAAYDALVASVEPLITADAGNRRALYDQLLALHKPADEEAEFFHRDEPSEHCEPTCTEQSCEGHCVTVKVCQECGYDHEDGDHAVFRSWPCPTVKALAEFAGVEASHD